MCSAYSIPTDPNATWYSWSSKHTGVVQFAMCDGSVRALPKFGGLICPQPNNESGCAQDTSNTTRNVFIYLSGMNDGSVINGSVFP